MKASGEKLLQEFISGFPELAQLRTSLLKFHHESVPQPGLGNAELIERIHTLWQNNLDFYFAACWLSVTEGENAGDPIVLRMASIIQNWSVILTLLWRDLDEQHSHSPALEGLSDGLRLMIFDGLMTLTLEQLSRYAQNAEEFLFWRKWVARIFEQMNRQPVPRYEKVTLNLRMSRCRAALAELVLHSIRLFSETTKNMNGIDQLNSLPCWRDTTSLLHSAPSPKQLWSVEDDSLVQIEKYYLWLKQHKIGVFSA